MTWPHSLTLVFVYLGQAYVSNCLRHIRIGKNMGHLFTLPFDLSARELGLVGFVVHGTVFLAERPMQVCCCS